MMTIHECNFQPNINLLASTCTCDASPKPSSRLATRIWRGNQHKYGIVLTLYCNCLTCPLVLLISAVMAASRELLPEPTVPTTPTSWPYIAGVKRCTGILSVPTKNVQLHVCVLECQRHLQAVFSNSNQ